MRCWWALLLQTQLVRSGPRGYGAAPLSSLKRARLLARSLARAAILSASAASASAPPQLDALVFCPGFLLPRSFYALWEEELRAALPSRLYVHASDGRDSLAESAAALLATVRGLRLPARARLLLCGHSRGGAVALMAAPALAAHSLVVDPVDDAALSAAAAVEKGGAGGRALLVATPFGGRSAYYGASFASSCAPAGRDAEALFAALRRGGRHASLLRLPELGHTQLFLGPAEESAAASLCAANEAVDALVPRGRRLVLSAAQLLVANEPLSEAALRDDSPLRFHLQTTP